MLNANLVIWFLTFVEEVEESPWLLLISLIIRDRYLFINPEKSPFKKLKKGSKEQEYKTFSSTPTKIRCKKFFSKRQIGS
jgi:hypothetical protein